jgi:hypothetical protein
MTVALLLAISCLGLTACGSASDPAKRVATRKARIAYDQHLELLDFVSCARLHGIDLPEPNAQNRVTTLGVNLKSRRRKTAVNVCYHKAVIATEQAYAAERARENASSKPPAATVPAQAQTPPPAQPTKISARQHKQLVKVVSCARRHGIDLPEPNAQNKIITRGVDVKGRRREAILNACVREVV